MKKFAILDKDISKIKRTYFYSRKKNLKIQSNEEHFEMLPSNGTYWDNEEPYSWDSVSNIVVFDNTFSPPPSYIPQPNPLVLKETYDIETMAEEYVEVSGMKYTPEKGKYTIQFSAQAYTDKYVVNYFSIWVGGVILTERKFRNRKEKDIMLATSVVLDGTQEVKVMYKVEPDDSDSEAPFEMYERSLILNLGE